MLLRTTRYTVYIVDMGRLFPQICLHVLTHSSCRHGGLGQSELMQRELWSGLCRRRLWANGFMQLTPSLKQDI